MKAIPKKRTPRPEPRTAPTLPRQRKLVVAICLGLVVLSLLAFGGAVGCDFVNFDDDVYVTNCQPVQIGLTGGGLVWALTTFHSGNWHPLTWLSLQLDATGSLFLGAAETRPNAALFHLTNVLIHTANVLLLFLVLRRLTGTAWRSAAVAALFAVHPLRVESVAWVAERKDVLSVFFGLLAVAAYARYAARPSVGRFLPVLAAQLASLLAKPMLVTLPFLLLLIDWWPLGRWTDRAAARRLLLEKLPLVGLSAAFGIVTLFAQASSDAVQSLAAIAPGARLANALAAVAAYLGQTFWPVALAVHYPLRPLGLGEACAAALLVGGVTVILLAWVRQPALSVGWLWFGVALLPVLGLVQVGDQARADRYTYLPQIGLWIVLVWGVSDWLACRRVPTAVSIVLTAAVIVGCTLLTRQQVECWRNSLNLWRHAVAVTEPTPSWKAVNNYGNALERQAREDQIDPEERKALLEAAAENLLRAATKLTDHPVPRSVSYTNLALVLSQLGRAEEGRAYLAKSLELEPTLPTSHQLLGELALREGNMAEAEKHLAEAVRLDIQDPQARFLLGSVQTDRGALTPAREHFTWILERVPSHFGARLGLGKLEMAGQHYDKAAAHFAMLAQLYPKMPEGSYQLGVVLLLEGRPGNAVAALRAAVDAGQRAPQYLVHLAYALAETGHNDQARDLYDEATRAAPQWLEGERRRAWRLASDPEAGLRAGPRAMLLARIVCQAAGTPNARQLDTLAATCAEVGRFDEAAATARRALAAPDPPPGVRERLQLYEARKPYREAPE
jgi:tetratricopeptide (TPR) repeat protein